MSRMSQQTLPGVYPGLPGHLANQLQSMYMQPLLQQCLFPLSQVQNTALPPFLTNPPSTGPGEVDEVGSRLEQSRDASVSPAGWMVSGGRSGEQEEKEDYLAELTREKEALTSRGMTRERGLLVKLLERGA